jgi:hypothetical protein
VADEREEAAVGEAAQARLRKGIARAKALVDEARHRIADPQPEPEPEPAPPNPPAA